MCSCRTSTSSSNSNSNGNSNNSTVLRSKTNSKLLTVSSLSVVVLFSSGIWVVDRGCVGNFLWPLWRCKWSDESSPPRAVWSKKTLNAKNLWSVKLTRVEFWGVCHKDMGLLESFFIESLFAVIFDVLPYFISFHTRVVHLQKMCEDDLERVFYVQCQLHNTAMHFWFDRELRIFWLWLSHLMEGNISMLSEMVSLVMHLSLKLLVSLNTYLYTCCLPVYLVIFPVTFTHSPTHQLGRWREGGREGGRILRRKVECYSLQQTLTCTLCTLLRNLFGNFFSALKVAATWCVK